MNATAHALNAYKSMARQTNSHREIQAKVFGQITAELSEAQQGGKQAFPRLVAALDRNRKLWDMLFVELCDEGHPYTPELRAQMISLFHFVRRHTQEVLRSGGDVSPIIDVNRAIAAGLSGNEPAAMGTDAHGRA